MEKSKKIKAGSDCCGVGAFPQSLRRLNVEYNDAFSCDFDYYARLTYLLNYGTEEDIELGNTKEHKFFSDKVKQIALKDSPITEKEQNILEDANEFAKKFSFYYPFNMYQRDIPNEPIDLYMSSVPCQSFSLAGKRLGKDDKRGILFFNSLEFIQKNKPRYFIFENVKGLLSDDSGKTFNEWTILLGGKTINGNMTIFPPEDAVPYHLYWQVLNAKDYNIPQNRERVFLVGIRDDSDNDFTFPKEIPLTKRLKDVLEDEVDDKYYLSDKMLESLEYISNSNHIFEKDNFFIADYRNDEGLRIRKDNISPCMTARRHSEKDISTMPALVGYDYKIRRLTPRECFRLMDFDESFDFSVVSDTQAYKQAGNSICVGVLAAIINNLNLK